MRKIINTIIVLGLFFVFTGCSTIRYNIALQNVESPNLKNKSTEIKELVEKKEKVNQSGKSTIITIYKYEYKDDNIEIIFTPTNYDIGFEILNKTNDSIKVIWDDAAFVDITGNSHKIMHNGVKYIDRNASWPASIIVKQQKLSDVIVPTDYIKWEGKDWVGTSFLPVYSPEGTQNIKDLARDNLGKKVQVLLPLQINNQLNNYLFTFEVKNFEIVYQ